jgi:predicted transcriptional regulator
MTNARPQRRPHGALRDEILGILIGADVPVTARQVVAELAHDGKDAPAITTVLTVLDRLRRAGEVERTRAENGELLFTPAAHEPTEAADDMLAALLRSKDRTGALASFAGNLDRSDLDVLRRYLGDDSTQRQRRSR